MKTEMVVRLVGDEDDLKRQLKQKADMVHRDRG